MTAAVKLARIAGDYYPTPPPVVHAILPHLPLSRSVLDPCCGTGEILREVPCVDTFGIELDQVRAEQAMDNGVHGVIWGNALEVAWPSADAAIFNAPFADIEAFASRAMEWRSQDTRRTVAMLARLTFLESASRQPFHRAHPSDVFVFSRRPRFRGDTTGTDSVTAAWFVFGPGRGGMWQTI